MDRSGFIIFLNCFHLLTILGKIYHSRWSVKITSLSLLPLSHFLATCKKQDVMFIVGERKTRRWVFSDFVLLGPVFVFIFLSTCRKSYKIFKVLFNFQQCLNPTESKVDRFLFLLRWGCHFIINRWISSVVVCCFLPPALYIPQVIHIIKFSKFICFS